MKTEMMIMRGLSAMVALAIVFSLCAFVARLH